MMNRAIWLMAVLMSGLLAAAPGHANVGENMLGNGGFETGEIAPYGVYDIDSANPCTAEVVTECVGAAVPGGPIEGTYCLHIVVPAPTAEESDWWAGMSDNSLTFKNGKRYILSCFMKCKSGTLKVRLKPERGEDPYEPYNEREVTVTTAWQKFSVMTPIMPERVTPASPTFHFNFAAGDFWIDDVRLYEVQDEGATYTWTGAAGDLQWGTPGNWEATGSIYSWPNEEFGLPRVNQDAGEITIGNGDMVAHPGDLEIRSGRHGSGEACLVIENNSVLHQVANMWIGRKANRGRVEVRNGGILVLGNLRLGQDTDSLGALDVADGTVFVSTDVLLSPTVGADSELRSRNGTLMFWRRLVVGQAGTGTAEVQGGTVEIQKDLTAGDKAGSTGTLDIKDGMLTVGSLIVGQAGTGTAEIQGGTLGLKVYLIVGGSAAGTGTLRIKAGTINVGKVFFAQYDQSVAVVEIDGGVVNVRDTTFLNVWGTVGSRADFTLNGGTWNSGGDIRVGTTLVGGDGCLTVNGGTMVTAGAIVVGPYPPDYSWVPNQARVFLNGGLLQGEGLGINMKSDSLIVFRGGELWVNGSSLPEAAMQDLIDQGSIEVPDDYEITTIDGYTVLRLSGM